MAKQFLSHYHDINTATKDVLQFFSKLYILTLMLLIQEWLTNIIFQPNSITSTSILEHSKTLESYQIPSLGTFN